MTEKSESNPAKRDEVLKRMLKMPHRPHKPPPKPARKSGKPKPGIERK